MLREFLHVRYLRYSCLHKLHPTYSRAIRNLFTEEWPQPSSTQRPALLIRNLGELLAILHFMEDMDHYSQTSTSPPSFTFDDASPEQPQDALPDRGLDTPNADLNLLRPSAPAEDKLTSGNGTKPTSISAAPSPFNFKPQVLSSSPVKSVGHRP